MRRADSATRPPVFGAIPGAIHCRYAPDLERNWNEHNEKQPFMMLTEVNVSVEAIAAPPRRRSPYASNRLAQFLPDLYEFLNVLSTRRASIPLHFAPQPSRVVGIVKARHAQPGELAAEVLKLLRRERMIWREISAFRHFFASIVSPDMRSVQPKLGGILPASLMTDFKP